MRERTLHVAWDTSCGRDTYGYTIATLREFGQLKSRCNGGGYDMRETVFGDWLTEEYQDRLKTIKNRMSYRHSKKDGFKRNERKNHLYGGTWDKDRDRISLNGACGMSSMVRIAEAIGLKVRQIDAGKKVDIILVTDTREDQ